MSADQTAAYDLLCHEILKEKLELYYNFSEEAIGQLPDDQQEPARQQLVAFRQHEEQGSNWLWLRREE